MVGRFLRLRLALFRAGFRTGNIATSIGTVLGLMSAVVLGLGGLVAGTALRWAPTSFVTVVVPVALAVIYLVWLIGPVTVAGTDAALDPVKFVLLPLKRRDLALGLAAAGLVGPGGIATALTVLGIVIGVAPAGPGLVPVVLAGLLFLGLCILSSRCLVSLVGMGLRRRGVRDVLAVAIPLVIIVLGQLPNIIQNVARAAGKDASAAFGETLVPLLRFSPSSFAAQAFVAGHRGDVLTGLLEIAAGIAFCTAVGFAWSVLLRRVMTTSPGVQGAVKARASRRFRTRALLPRLSPRAGAVADKDLTLLFREPAQRVQLIMAVIFGLAVGIVPGVVALTTTGSVPPAIAFIGAGLGMFLGLLNSNLYGYDGSSMWVNVAAGDDARSDLLGKAVARLVVFTPIIVIAALVCGLLIAPTLLPATIGCAVGAWLVCLGLGLLQSVLAPYPIVISEDSAMARSQGSFQAVIAQLITFPIVGLLVGPFVLMGIYWGTNPLVALAVGLGAILVGLAGLYGGFRLAVAYSGPRQPELLQQVAKRTES